MTTKGLQIWLWKIRYYCKREHMSSCLAADPTSNQSKTLTSTSTETGKIARCNIKLRAKLLTYHRALFFTETLSKSLPGTHLSWSPGHWLFRPWRDEVCVSPYRICLIHDPAVELENRHIGLYVLGRSPSNWVVLLISSHRVWDIIYSLYNYKYIIVYIIMLRV